MSQTNKQTFDFTVYDAVMKNVGVGLKLILAKQLLTDVADAAVRFEHPLAKDLSRAALNVEGLRAMWKVLAQKAQQDKAA